MADRIRIIIICILTVTFFGCTSEKDLAQEYANSASQYLNEAKFDEARNMLLKASVLRPDVSSYHVGIAFASVKLRDYANAKERYEIALKLIQNESISDPQRVDDHLMLLVLLDREDEARKLLREKMKVYPEEQSLRMLYKNFDDFVHGFSEWKIP